MPETNTQVDKAQLLEHLDLCAQLIKDENVRKVLQNLKQDVEAGQFDAIAAQD
ncbi:hypothetical protein [Paenibacillus mesophilus]|uniref:hypothetical protein n=1 Tax=Paenibacillus mesophilus TaxID=2582849 RepID=UPI0013052899|nr:hypothetical protein [Paenibacillus mesophilus]